MTRRIQRKMFVRVREASKKGFSIAEPGDIVNISHLGSTTKRARVKKGVAHTLVTNCHHGLVEKDLRIRRLTPKECWRLQGFPDWAYEKAREVTSDTQLYRQTGNSVSIPVIYEIARRLK